MTGFCELVVVRHGQTKANISGILQGQLNTDLDELGNAQAEALAQRLKTESFDRIISSDLGRAVETAEKIRRFFAGIPFEPTSQLREWDLGELEGKRIPELNRDYAGIMKAFRVETGEILVPGGESKSEFGKRIGSYLDSLAAQYHGKRLLLVAHGGVLQAVFRHAVGPVRQGSLLSLSDNTSVNIFRHYPQGWQLVAWNDASHLKDVGVNALFTY